LLIEGEQNAIPCLPSPLISSPSIGSGVFCGKGIAMAKNMSKNALQKTVIKFIRDKQKQQTVEYEENQEKEKEKQKLDMNSFLSWLQNEMNSYAIEIRHITSKKDGDTSNNNSDNTNSSINNNSRSSRQHIYILKHDAGYKYSLYYKTLLESIFNEILQKHISTKIKSTTLTFEFQEQSI
jgi:outer membrane receptor for ferrienterochelin and colicin